MEKEDLLKILEDVSKNILSPQKALEKIRDFPYKNFDFVKLDNNRKLRKDLGEVIYAKNKNVEQLKKICLYLKNEKNVIYTKVNKKKAKYLLSWDNKLEYNKEAKMVYKSDKTIKKEGKVIILAAGTSDIKVAEEAYVTLTVMGNIVEKYYDVGVAGLHRLLSIYDKIIDAKVIIAIAGMEGALPTVVSGLVNCPVIAVPTSVGYGANFKGISALLTMINSCSPGIAVVNIDNGFGAGYLASLINNN